jgi:tubulin monoglycylase TTLL15
VVITSVDPLRVYYYEKDILLRFCKLPYDPNNYNDTRTYVIDDSHIAEINFPEMKKYLRRSYSSKQAFNAIMREMGHNPQILYDQVEDCINTVLLSKEHLMINKIDKLNPSYGKHHFFELYRFDFVIDASLNVHLMEINMSPNLQAEPKHITNRPLHESVIYNFMNLVGVGSYLQKSKI